jgi:hypothetical protein
MKRAGAFPSWGAGRAALLSAVLVCAGCVEVRTGAYAHAVDPAGKVTSSEVTRSGLRISGEAVDPLSSAYFGLIEITFENTSSRWLRVVSVSARFAGAQSNRLIQVPIAEDLQSWVRASLEHYEISTAGRGDYPEVADAWSTLQYAVAGSVCATPGGDLSVVPPASAAASGEPSAAANAPAAASRESVSSIPPPPPLIPLTLERANALAGSDALVSALPDTHLLHVPFSLPPGLFSRRFIVLDTSQAPQLPCLRELSLEVQLEDGSKERVWLRFRGDRLGAPTWQSKACEHG